MNNRFHDTVPVTPKRMPREVTVQEADAAIRASWPPRRAAEPQPMAAEACTEVDELPAADDYDFSHSRRDRATAGWFWSLYLAGVLVAVCAFIARFLPA